MKRLTLCILLCILVAACCACRPTTPLSGEERLAMEAVRAAKTYAIQQGAAPQDLTFLAVQAGRQEAGPITFQVVYRLAGQTPEQTVQVFYQIAGTDPLQSDSRAARYTYLSSPIHYGFDIRKLLLNLETGLGSTS